MIRTLGPRRTASLVAVASAAVLAVVGCSSGKSASSSDTTTNPALTKSTIKIGQLISLTGPASSSDKGGANVAKAWAKWVNTNGGINGHPVELVIKDDRGDGATSATAAKDLVADPNVLAITSSESSTETTVSEYLKTQQIAVIGAVGYSPAIWGAIPNYFSTVPSGFPADVLAQFMSAKAVDAKNWSSLYCAESAACKAAEGLYKPAAAQQGLNYTGSLSVAVSQPSYSAECLKLIKQQTDFIQLNFSPAGSTRFVADCNAQGYNGYYGATAGSVSNALTSIKGIKLAGGLHGFPWWVDDPKVKEYRDAMAKYESKESIAIPSNTAVWAALELTRKALATAGDAPTRQDVFTGLYSLKDENLGGLLPQKMTYTKGKPAPQVLCLWLYKLADGKFVGAPQSGPSGNGVTGPLKTDCVKPLG
jgi:branched-chain amino acid transport system substrate-binding protein